MDTFIGIRFKKETAKRFQEFSRTHFKTHTEAMETILDFFFYNEISPKENLGPTGRTIEAKLLKRINAVIAIMRDVEKTQTKPTVAMLQFLFEMEEPKKKPLILEKKYAEEKKEVRFRESELESFTRESRAKR
ncbi:BfmA/BtgA family mobilization protein [Galbibacter sp. PAP.153]|uniref:BfmA/BtgA family mobilization protein n=1 Tax=Galbibacter sp. PAP.153 TaxID=3104623 RepID=UPI003008424C